MQTDNINFTDIWNKKTVEIPNIHEIKSKADIYRKKQLKATICHMSVLLATAFGIIFIWNVIDFKMISIVVGFVLILIALGLYIFLSYQKISMIRKINPSISNQQYLASLKKLHLQQIYMQTKGIGIYYILMTLGFAFYFYEFALRMSTSARIMVYGLTSLWLAVTWFVLRPRQIRKQNEKILKIIDSLETIENVLEE